MLTAPPTTLVTILASGSSLGAYVPALLLDRQLCARGLTTDVLLIENSFLGEKRDNIAKTKSAFHHNFALARMAQKLVRDIEPSLDHDGVERLLAAWESEGRTRFIVVYGFWVPILARYLARASFADAIRFDLVHPDSVISPSWRYDTTDPRYRHLWLCDGQQRRINYRLQVADTPPLAYEQRNGRFVIHGGGWGLGTYQERIPQLTAQGIGLDITVHEPGDLTDRAAAHRYYMIDPAWQPWERDADGRHRFAPLGEVAPDGAVVYTHCEDCPCVYELIRNALGIISKPGGSTLIDSLSAATPLILLEPFGEHEQRNAEAWLDLGFAIHYRDWAAEGYGLAVLERLHCNLSDARERVPNFVDAYCSLR